MKLCLVLIASLCVACAAGSPFSKLREFLSDAAVQEIECHDGVCSSTVNRLSKRNAESDLEQRTDDGIVRVKRGGPGSAGVGENGGGLPPTTPPPKKRGKRSPIRAKRSPNIRGERQREEIERERERHEDRRELMEEMREHRQEEERMREKHREEEERLEKEHRREEFEQRRRDEWSQKMNAL